MPANIGAELQALPLEYLIAAPLTAAIKGQALAAQTTADFISSVLLSSDTPDGSAQARMVSFSFDTMTPDPTDPNNSISRNTTLSVPLMAIVHTPHIRIHDMTIAFEFKIRDIQTVNTMRSLSAKATTSLETEYRNQTSKSIGSGWGLSALLSAKGNSTSQYAANFKFTATGSATYQRTERNTTDRSATYKFNLNVKEEAPEGFRRVLEILNNSITQTAAAPAAPPGP